MANLFFERCGYNAFLLRRPTTTTLHIAKHFSHTVKRKVRHTFEKKSPPPVFGVSYRVVGGAGAYLPAYLSIHLSIYLSIYLPVRCICIYIYTYICICVYVCICIYMYDYILYTIPLHIRICIPYMYMFISVRICI